MALQVTSTPANVGTISGVQSAPSNNTSIATAPVQNPTGAAQGTNINQTPPPVTPVQGSTNTSSNPTLSNLATSLTPQTPTPSNGAGLSFMNGSMDANGNYVPNTQAINSSLNSAQQNTYDNMGTPNVNSPSALNTAQNTALQGIQNTMEQQQQDENAGGTQNLNTAAMTNYQTAGVADEEAQVQQAMQASNQAQAALQENQQSVEASATGQNLTQSGGQAITAQNALQLQTTALVAALNVQTAQQNLSVKTDFYNSLNTAAATQNSNVIAQTAQKLGVDANDLSTFQGIYQQALQETNQNQQAASQLVTQILTNIPGAWQTLTPQEQQAISTTGIMPPTAAAKLAKFATLQQQTLQNTQANTAIAKSQAAATNLQALITSGQASTPAGQALVNGYIQQMLGGLGGGTGMTGNTAQGSTVTTSTGTVNIGNYNTNPGYASSVQTIANNIGTASTTPQGIQSYISQIAPNSPITGDMVSQTAQATGADPTALMAIMQKESTFGTSSVAQQNNNYGGIMYVGQANATQGSARPAAEGGYYAKYATPQDGLTALGQRVAEMNQTQANPGGQAVQLQGAAAPYSNNVKLTQNGSRYISQDQIPAVSTAVGAQAQQALNAQGIATPTTADADTLDNIKTTQQDLTDFQQAIQGINPGSTAQRFFTTANGEVNLQQWLQTSGQAGAYNTWQTGVLSLLGSLKEGTSSASASRLYNTLSADLPTSTDTIQTANQKIADLYAQMDNNEKSILGNYYVSSPASAAASMGGIAQ